MIQEIFEDTKEVKRSRKNKERQII